MTDRPILFSGPMVRALLDGRKTQTRRVAEDVPPQPASDCHPKHEQRHPQPYLDSYCSASRTADNPRGMTDRWGWWQVDDRACLPQFRVGYVPGDRLWVREDHWLYGRWAPVLGAKTKGGGQKWAFDRLGFDCFFESPLEARNGLRRSDPAPGWYKRLGRFMPRALSRLTLIVEEVRVERLQAISREDAIAEGCDSPLVGTETPHPGPGVYLADERTSFAILWNSINGPTAWGANPWVVAVSFRVVRANIDDKGLLAGWVAP
jgi:hypothetical protein